ncbi:hypothetical protein ACFQZ4_07560 [Catellatospora coxensis]
MTGDSYAAEPLRVRADAAFWRYWAASATSTFGAGVTTVALPLVALTVLGASISRSACSRQPDTPRWSSSGCPPASSCSGTSSRPCRSPWTRSARWRC